MVSFFGLKFGDRKKKSDGKPPQDKGTKGPQQWKRIDQNALGEGQLFGRNVHQKGFVNGSIRSVSRAGTPQPGGIQSPYALHDTHNLAAASMFDLSNIGPPRRGSQTSFYLRSHASDANLRTRFGTNNGSSTSLAAPGPGFGARPSTASGRTKPWVNPLDVHFMRSTPSGSPAPRSPLAQSAIQLPPTPTTAKSESGSVFGEEVDDMVDAVMASVKKREEEARKAKERERELERQRETARLELERLERQKSTESTLAVKPPSAAQPQPETLPRPPDESSLMGPAFKGNIVYGRPGSRNGVPSCPNSSSGPMRSTSLHSGPPPTGPPTQCLPRIPGQGPPRQRAFGRPGEGLSGHSTRPPEPTTSGSRSAQLHKTQLAVQEPQDPRPYASGAESLSQPNAPPPTSHRPYRPPPHHDRGLHGPVPNGPSQVPSPTAFSVDEHRSQSPAHRGPTAAVHSPRDDPNSEPQSPASNGRGTPGPETQGLEPLISTLMSPSESTSRSSLNDETIEQFARPIIRDVAAKRDTLAFNTPRQQSLSMRIEELEKTLLNAQQAHQAQKAEVKDANRSSTTSSFYSDGLKEDDDDDDDGPILPIQPAPLRIASPAATPLTANRPQSPFRGPLRRGLPPRRPALEEYGVSSSQLASRSRGSTPTPASASGKAGNHTSPNSPPSQVNSPRHHPKWRRDPSQPSPAPTPDAAERSRPSPIIDTGFNFDFGPGVAAPPTPDSTNWPLASPTSDSGSTPAPAPPPELPQAPVQTAGAPPKFTRSNVPPPLNLKFNFSPDAPSRDPTLGSSPGLFFTPPLHPAPIAASSADGRPSTSAGLGGTTGLAASPRLISQFPESVPRDDDPAACLGIGMARGLSIREGRRPGSSARRAMVDSFGTGFI
ncbi:hypothetical protein VTK56DRAFT_4095 [Thermocarpiscus australiensis]